MTSQDKDLISKLELSTLKIITERLDKLEECIRNQDKTYITINDELRIIRDILDVHRSEINRLRMQIRLKDST